MCASAHSMAWGTPARWVATHARRAWEGLNPTSVNALVRNSRFFSFPFMPLAIKRQPHFRVQFDSKVKTELLAKFSLPHCTAVATLAKFKNR
mmetsp:Transcript_88270/g.234724  ORF Transcript_88270/g.234724 Transcript_88270/m.234724 type:complete len:92 (-) Transcript_88270:8-283(-)